MIIIAKPKTQIKKGLRTPMKKTLLGLLLLSMNCNAMGFIDKAEFFVKDAKVGSWKYDEYLSEAGLKNQKDGLAYSCFVTPFHAIAIRGNIFEFVTHSGKRVTGTRTETKQTIGIFEQFCRPEIERLDLSKLKNMNHSLRDNLGL